MRGRSLSISPIPFRSSRLATPPSPFSPRLPLTPPITPPKTYTLPRIRHNRTPSGHIRAPPIPPPANPLHWLWQCHLCHRTYRLSVTRRCLDDGHLFCSGQTIIKRRNGTRSVKRHRACASEFDYQGWKAWVTWRSAIRTLKAAVEDTESAVSPLFGEERVLVGKNAGGFVTAPLESGWLNGPGAEKLHKDCWNECSYPSECRWGKQYGVATPTLPTSVAGAMALAAGQKETLSTSSGGKTTLEAILGEDELGEDEEELLAAASSSGDFGVVGHLDEANAPCGDVLAGLVARAKKRKSKSESPVPSPLASNPPEGAIADAAATISVPEQAVLKPEKKVMHKEAHAHSPVLAMAKAFDDFEFGLRKLAHVFSSRWSTQGTEDESSDLYVRDLRVD